MKNRLKTFDYAGIGIDIECEDVNLAQSFVDFMKLDGWMAGWILNRIPATQPNALSCLLDIS